MEERNVEEVKFDWKFKLKLKYEMLKKKVCETGENVLNWVHDNPELSVAIATVTVPAACKAVKSASRAISDRTEEKHRMLTTYDHRTDTYLQLRRPMKRNEQEILAHRMNNGESKTMILRDLGLLK